MKIQALTILFLICVKSAFGSMAINDQVPHFQAINSEGKSFKLIDWHSSNTYCFKETSRILISDKHTRKYENMSSKEKKNIIKVVWGN